MAWILLGHSYYFIQFIPLNNIRTAEELFESPMFGVVGASYFGIDTFFFISGIFSCFVLANKIYRQLDVKYWKFYFNKYYRVIFTLMIAEGIIICIMPYMGDGPVYRKSWQPLTHHCNKYWITNLFFVNNIIPWCSPDS